MKHKKMLAMLMAMAMVIGLIGCNKTPVSDDETKAPDSKPSVETSAADDEASWTNDDTAEITILYAGDNTPDQDNIVLQELEKKTNTKINMVYVPKGDFETKRTAMITGGDVPDIFAVDVAYATELKNAGMLADLTDVLEFVAPELLETYGENLEKVAVNDDGIYLVPNMATYYPVGLDIRADWLENLDLEMPTDLESFAEVMHAFTYDDPDGNGVDDTFGLNGSYEFFKTNDAFSVIFGAYGIPLGKTIELEDGTITSYVKHERFLEAMEYVKGLIDDGVCDPDFMTIPNMSEWEKLWNGKCGAIEFPAHGPLANWMPGRYTEDPVPEFCWTLLEGPYGDYGTQAVYPNLTSGYVVSADSKNLEGVARIIEFCMSEEGNDLLYLGVEGVMYEWIDKEEGTYQRLGDYVDDTVHRQHGGWCYSEMFQPLSIAEVRTMEKQAQEALAHSRENAIDWPYILEVSEVATEYGADMDQVLNEMKAELIQCDVEDMQAVYDRYIAEWEAVGGSDWEEEVTALWKAQNK